MMEKSKESNNNNNNDINQETSEENTNSVKQLMNSKTAQRIRLLLAIISLILFLVQLWFISVQYLEYNTVVSTELVKPTTLTIPAVTVCVPAPATFRSLCPQENTDAECFQRLKDDADVEGQIGLKRNNLVTAFHINKYITSAPAKKLLMEESEKIFHVPGCFIAKSQRDTNYFSVPTSCQNNTNVVGSLVYNLKGSNMAEYCGTFFSRFDPYYDEDKLEIYLPHFHNVMSWLEIDVRDNQWFPEDKFEGIRIAVHPSNMIPNDADWKYIKVFANNVYTIEYTRTVSNLLEKPYKTMCTKYGVMPMSRHECVRKCIYDASWDQESNCRRQWNVILLKELGDDEKLCQFDVKKDIEFFSVKENCEKKCPSACFQEEYRVNSEITHTNHKTHNESNFDLSNVTKVLIRHQAHSDLIITHFVEMTFSNYVANVGGLMAIYLGISIIALYDYFIRSLVLIATYRKKPQTQEAIKL